MAEEFRREMIMLRPLQGGLNGFIRLETRTMRGSARLTATGLAGAYDRASLVAAGIKNGQWHAINLTPVLVTNAGQSGAIWEFDPRNIDGMEISQLSLIGVADDMGELILASSMLKGKELNWAAAKDAVLSLYADAVPSMAPTVEEDQDQPIHVHTPEPVPLIEIEIAPPVSDERTTLNLLLLDEALWPEDFKALMPVFAAGEIFTPFDVPGFIFVKAPVPEETGMSYIGVGVDVTKKPLTLFAYAIPGAYAPEPPPGLEGYEWRQGDDGGHWVIFLESEAHTETPDAESVFMQKTVAPDWIAPTVHESPWEECDCGADLEAI